MSALGVGVVYQTALEELLTTGLDLAAVVEVEPQTFWRTTATRDSYVVDRAALERIASLPQAKLIHSVGSPLGGSEPLDRQQFPPLLQTIDALSGAWASEHLAFNHARDAGGAFHTGFLLPPRQTEEGVEVAAAAIRELANALPVPLAVETGVNYLRPRRDELSDGAFVRAVVERADCSILLDLHNAWTNERNGRQTIEEFCSEIPLERVVEVHLAGGFDLDGYWLDAHSDLVPDALFERALAIVPRLPALRAIIFEILDPFIPRVGVSAVAAQLEALWRLWDRRGRQRPPAPRRAASPPEPTRYAPSAWESTLGALVLGRRGDGALRDELERDPAIPIFRRLVWQVRAGMIVDNLTLTCRLVLLARGETALRAIFDEFFEATPPAPFGANEAKAFAVYLRSLGIDILWLNDILELESAALEVATEGQPRKVALRIDPDRLITALTGGTIPEPGGEMPCVVELVPDRNDDIPE